MRWIAAALTSMFFCVNGASSSAADDSEEVCALEAVSVEGQADLAYYPFANREEVGQLRLVIVTHGSCRLGFALLPTSDAQLLGPGRPLNFSFRNRGDQVIPLNGNEQRGIQFEDTARGREASLIIGFPRGQARRAGDYRNNFVARIFADGRPLQDIDFQVSVRVAAQADIHVAGNGEGQLGRSTVMNFGKLETGETLSALLAVRTNSAYNLVVSSENHGQMQHVSLEGENTAVPYTASIDGKPLSLQSGADARDFPTPGDGEEMRNISVEIGDTRGRMAGRYRDTLRVTVTLLE
ncbi:hypothetical protein [Microbulbifer pacificus]|uniref:Spore coat protein U domain-containing protein n=1 Tax=Microbulbifer pacificus TaxID=407164 RepID=A0AAU0N3N8_9GAMM|nr:hypothetical protein [Microbulbifer pacificus]WOX07113.1 hypothetical protein R5R33_08260 [Microbulbifer pacificus]